MNSKTLNKALNRLTCSLTCDGLLFDSLCKLLDRNWTVPVQHIYKKTNIYTDWLDSKVVDDKTGLTPLIEPAIELKKILKGGLVHDSHNLIFFISWTLLALM